MKISFLYSVLGIFICVSVVCLVLAIISHDIFFLGISGLLALSAVLVGLEIKDIKNDPFNLQ
jgi:membrane-bound ClpP family serine protease